MSIILLLVGGILASPEAASCIEALHQLRSVERLEIVATDVLEDNVLAFTLSDSSRLAEKTAILLCQRDVAAEDEDDLASGDDLEPEVLEPSDDTGDATGDATDDALQDEALVE